MMPQKLKEKKLVHYSLDGELEMFAKYLSEGVDPNCIDNDGWTSLLAASYRGHYKIVKLALEKGANVNARDKEGGMPCTGLRGTAIQIFASFCWILASTLWRKQSTMNRQSTRQSRDGI